MKKQRQKNQLGLLVTMQVVLSGSAGATANAADISHPKLGMKGR